MRWLRNCLLFAAIAAPALIAPLPGISAAKPAAPAAGGALPDYGARDAPSIPLSEAAGAPDPLAQAGRSLAALVIVLGGIYGVVVLLKRAGYTGSGPLGPALLAGVRASKSPAKPSDPPADRDSALALVESQSLPGGGAVHLLSINGTTLVLVGATAQGVTRLAEWEWDSIAPAPEEVSVVQAEFSDYLTRAEEPMDPPPSTDHDIPRQRVSDLLSTTRLESHDEVSR